MEQLSLFQATYDDYRITNPIRLIECFGGIGAQSKALEVLGADFEDHSQGLTKAAIEGYVEELRKETL